MATSLFTKGIIIYLVIRNVISKIKVVNERQIEGKVVVVTGGAQGIGFAIADNFLKNGAKTVVILDIDVAKGKEAERELNSKYGGKKSEFIECDVTKDLTKVCKIIKKKYGYTDILVNNAGIADESKPRMLMTTNAIATIEIYLKFNEFMRKDKCGGKGGAIINIASIVAHYIDPVAITYKASKFAISGFSQSLGQEYNYNKTGVRVLTICPGITDTRLGVEYYDIEDTRLMTALGKGYDFKILQSSNHVGKYVVELFKYAETGTSWDITNMEPPFESTKTIKVVNVD